MPVGVGVRLTPIPAVRGPAPSTPLGPLEALVGKWQGEGLNLIFRPLQAQFGQDNFLELNLTLEALTFTEIPGEIPNRGFAQPDISLFGLTYLQQVSDAIVKDTDGNPAGLHIEPGIWINVPPTSGPQEPATIARLATIPHGTAVLAQGTAEVASGQPTFPTVDITPFVIGDPGKKVPFASQNLSMPSDFRSPPSDIVGITQAMVDNPNSVLEAALTGKTIESTMVLRVSTSSGSASTPNLGGGISDIAFLDGPTGNPNAQVVQMEATFWISNFTDRHGQGTLLQYSQVVLLNFSKLSWPHVSVGNLIKQATGGAEEVHDVADFGLTGAASRAGPAQSAPGHGRTFAQPAESPAPGA